MRKTKLTIIAHSSVILVALIALVFASFGSWQGSDAQPERIHFLGQYSADAAPFQPLTESTDLNANHGTVILRGNFVRSTGEAGLRVGENLNFFQNHIGVTIYVNGRLLYDADVHRGVDPDNDVDYLCGATWNSVFIEQTIEPRMR